VYIVHWTLHQFWESTFKLTKHMNPKIQWWHLFADLRTPHLWLKSSKSIKNICPVIFVHMSADIQYCIRKYVHWFKEIAIVIVCFLIVLINNMPSQMHFSLHFRSSNHVLFAESTESYARRRKSQISCIVYISITKPWISFNKVRKYELHMTYLADFITGVKGFFHSDWLGAGLSASPIGP
jgi:hypothetical protein